MGLDDAEEDVEVGLDGGRVEALQDGELGALLAVADVAVGDGPDLGVEGVGFVEGPGVVGAQRRVGRTVGRVQGVAGGPGLRGDGRDAGREKAEQQKERHGLPYFPMI